MAEYEVQVEQVVAIGDLVVTDEGVVAELIGMPDDEGIAWVQETDIPIEEVPDSTPYATRLLEYS